MPNYLQLKTKTTRMIGGIIIKTKRLDMNNPCCKVYLGFIPPLFSNKSLASLILVAIYDEPPLSG